MQETAVTPRQAATVALLRDATGGVEVFLLRRPSTSGFAADASVFPGGALDDADSGAVPDLAPRFDAARAAARMRLPASEDGLRLCAGLHVAAVRETFEESGVLIGRDRDGSALDASDAGRLSEARAACLAGVPFTDVLRDHRLELDPESLVYIAHFVTPVGEPRRYDTRFFAVAAPLSQPAAIDAAEATHGDWFAAAEIRERQQDGRMLLMPPTRIVCAEVSRHRSVEAVLDDLGRRPVPEILFDMRDVLAGRLPDRLPNP